MTAIIPTAIVWKTATGQQKEPRQRDHHGQAAEEDGSPSSRAGHLDRAQLVLPARRSERNRVIMKSE